MYLHMFNMFIYFHTCWTWSLSEQTGLHLHASLWFSETLVNHHLDDLMGVIVKYTVGEDTAISRQHQTAMRRLQASQSDCRVNANAWKQQRIHHFRMRNKSSHMAIAMTAMQVLTGLVFPHVVWGEVNHLQQPREKLRSIPGPLDRYQSLVRRTLRQVSRLGHLMNSKCHDRLTRTCSISGGSTKSNFRCVSLPNKSSTLLRILKKSLHGFGNSLGLVLETPAIQCRRNLSRLLPNCFSHCASVLSTWTSAPSRYNH